MKIIKPSPITEVSTVEHTCSSCQAILELTPEDFRIFYDQRDGDWLEAICISCKGRIVFDAKNYPFRTRGRYLKYGAK